MIKINLLPPEAAKKEAQRKIIILGIIACVGVISVAMIFFIVRLNTQRKLNTELSSLKEELKEYQQIVSDVKKLKSMTATLESRKRIINQLMENRLAYPKFMESFLSLLPPTVWIGSLNTVTTSDGLGLTIACKAFDNFGIADYISNLESSKKFANIDLGAISTGRQGNYEVLSFQITCKYFF